MEIALRRWIKKSALAVVPVLMTLLASSAFADTTFTARQMTRDDVPDGKGQCDIRFRVDNVVELTLRGNRVIIRTLAGRDSRDEGSECNFPLPNTYVDNFRWEKRDGRGKIELISEPGDRRNPAVVFRIQDSDGGDDRYHIRVNWDHDSSTSSNSGNRPGRPARPNRPGSGNNSGWGNNGNESGWGTGGNGWGNVNPPANLNAAGRGTVNWDRRADLSISRANVTVSGNRATIRFQTTANRNVELRGAITSSSNGFFEVDLDGSSEGNIDGVARIDYRNNSTLERIDVYGNAGNDRFRFDFRR